jgi:CRP-like cAMP-binding protein
MLYDVAKPLPRIKNHLLSTLRADEFQFIKPHLEPVSLENGRMLADLYDPVRHCFFPNNGMISLLSVTESGDTCEVGYVGHEGIVGLPAILGRNEMPYQVLVQARSEGYRVPVSIVTELFARGGGFHDDALRFAYVLLRQFAQTSACNRFHDIQSRLCRWFAIMCERSGDRNLALTQEFLAYMLGVQRTSVSNVANNLQDSGIIKYRRGKVEVCDLDRLRSLTCECYSVINEELTVFLAEKNIPHKSTTRQTRAR